MRVLHLSHCADRGGAARAAYRLHRALLAAGVDSTMWVKTKDVDDATVTALPTSTLMNLAALPARIRRKLDRSKIPSGAMFSSNRAIMSGLQLAGIEAFDVIHLHFLAHAFDLPALFGKLHPKQRIVWTLHDANPFTGGCHLFGQCERYIERCGACPQLTPLPVPGSAEGRRTLPASTLIQPHHASRVTRHEEDDLSRVIHRQKARLYAGRDMTFIGPSAWISSSCAGSSLGKPFRHAVIPHAIDTEAFSPIERSEAKRRVGVPSDRFVVGWLGASVNDPNKGLDLLLAALAAIDPSKLHLLWAGADERSLDLPYSQIRIGPISEHGRLVDFYSASDLFAMTSRSETFGLVAAEAAACGTPAVGFATTGVPDAIPSPRLGRLVAPFDVSALAAAIESYRGLSAIDYAACRESARLESVDRNNLSEWANRHVAVYQGL